MIARDDKIGRIVWVRHALSAMRTFMVLLSGGCFAYEAIVDAKMPLVIFTGAMFAYAVTREAVEDVRETIRNSSNHG